MAVTPFDTELGTRPGRLWGPAERRRLADALLRSPRVSDLLRFGIAHLGWSSGGRRVLAAWKVFLRSPAFEQACDTFDPSGGLDFPTHLLAAAQPRIKDTTPGVLWTWFDIAWVTRRGYEDETILNRMTYWVLGLTTGTSTDQPTWSQNTWIEFWVRRASAAIRAFDATGDFFEHVKVWAADVERRILALRARTWTGLERELVVQWLLRPPMLKRFAMIAITRGVPTDSVEDAIQTFWIAQGFDGFKGVLANYVPEPGVPFSTRFLRFVGVALGREATKFATKIRERSEQDVHIDQVLYCEDNQVHPELLSTGVPADQQLMDRESSDAIRSAIARCWSRLTARERVALESSLRERSHRDTANELGISEGAVKLAAHRARHRLRKLLSREAEMSPTFAASLTRRDRV